MKFKELQSSNIKKIEAAGEYLGQNIEHQSTLWHATPFAMIFLTAIFENTAKNIKMDKASQTMKHL